MTNNRNLKYQDDKLKNDLLQIRHINSNFML